MTSKPEPKLEPIKLHNKPIQLFPKIKLQPVNTTKLNTVVKFWPEKDKKDDGLPKS